MQVECDGDLELALRLFKKVVGKDGVHIQIKMRLANPKPSLRKRAKAARSLAKRKRAERKREHGFNKGFNHS
jgi:ribosomal protein S21